MRETTPQAVRACAEAAIDPNDATGPALKRRHEIDVFQCADRDARRWSGQR